MTEGLYGEGRRGPKIDDWIADAGCAPFSNAEHIGLHVVMVYQRGGVTFSSNKVEKGPGKADANKKGGQTENSTTSESRLFRGQKGADVCRFVVRYRSPSKPKPFYNDLFGRNLGAPDPKVVTMHSERGGRIPPPTSTTSASRKKLVHSSSCTPRYRAKKQPSSKHTQEQTCDTKSIAVDRPSSDTHSQLRSSPLSFLRQSPRLAPVRAHCERQTRGRGAPSSRRGPLLRLGAACWAVCVWSKGAYHFLSPCRKVPHTREPERQGLRFALSLPSAFVSTSVCAWAPPLIPPLLSLPCARYLCVMDDMNVRASPWYDRLGLRKL